MSPLRRRRRHCALPLASKQPVSSNSIPEVKNPGHASPEALAIRHGSTLDPRHNARQLIQIKQALRTALFSAAPTSKETAPLCRQWNLLAWFEWRSRLGAVLAISPDAPHLGDRCHILGMLLLRCTDAVHCLEGEAREQPRHSRLKGKPRPSRERNLTRDGSSTPALLILTCQDERFHRATSPVGSTTSTSKRIRMTLKGRTGKSLVNGPTSTAL